MSGQEGVNADQAALWNGLAGRAWVDEQAALDRMFAPFEPLLADLATAGAHVLDVGCGTGATTLALARRVGVRFVAACWLANAQAPGPDLDAPTKG